MKRYFALIVLLAIFPVWSTAQELPVFLMCLADADKPLEQEFCALFLGAIDAHPGTRRAEQTDRAVVFVTVIPYETEMCGDALAVSVTVTYGEAAPGAQKLYILSACDVMREADFIPRVVGMVNQTAVATREWMGKQFDSSRGEAIRLHTNP